METNAVATPAVPLTVEGSAVLHQMMHVDWEHWNAHPPEARERITQDIVAAVTDMEKAGTGVYALFGHKGDLMFVHFRENFDALHEAEIRIKRLTLSGVLEQTTSYLSVVELGLYDSTQKVYATLTGQGIEPHSPEWNQQIEETLKRQREAMRSRLFPDLPANSYVCFYPMDR